MIDLGPRKDIKEILDRLDTPEGTVPKEPVQPFPRDIATIIIDADTIENGWIANFNAKDKVMASMPDIYHAGKTGDEDLLAQLHGTLEHSWMTVSTKIIYQPNSLKAKIIHYFGSNLIDPAETELIIPQYWKFIKDIVRTDVGLTFMQTLLGTEDNGNEITTNLKKLSGKNKDILKLGTLQLYEREENPEVHVMFGNVDSLFRVSCGPSSLDAYNCGSYETK